MKNNLPTYWYVKITPGNQTILGEYWNKNSNNSCYTSFNSGYLHSHNDRTESILKRGNFAASFHEYREIKPGHEEITFEQFKQYVLKEKPIIMKAQTFGINGPKALLKAIWSELGELGYNIEAEETDFECIYHNMSDSTKNSDFTKKDYIELYNGYIGKAQKEFTLPQQYNEALAFAKEQLEDKYWGPQKWAIGTFVVFCVDIWRYKVGDIDVITESPTKSYTNMALKNDKAVSSRREDDGTFKWFATKKEAEAFALTLKPTPKNGDWIVITKKLSNSHSLNWWSVGSIYQLTSNISGDWFNVKKPTGETNGWHCKFIEFRFATPEEVINATKPVEVRLPFGSHEFIIYKDRGYASCPEGNITKAEIKAVIDWMENKPYILGYQMQLHSATTMFIKFGCYEGTRREAKAILEAFD
jgi:hypothetical protein